MVGVTAMWMASKYEEIYANEVKDYAYMTDFTYSIQQIIDLESQILIKIDFDLMTSSALNFLQIYWKFTALGQARSRQQQKGSQVEGGSNEEKCFFLARYILELSLQAYRMLKYSPS